MTRVIPPSRRSVRGGAFARRHVNAIAIDAGDRLDASRVWEFDEFRDFRVESHYTDTHGPLNALCRLRGGGGGGGGSRYPWTDSRRRPLNSRRVSSYRMRVSEQQCAHARAVTRGMPPACFVSCPDLPSRRTRRIHNWISRGKNVKKQFRAKKTKRERRPESYN